ncbi:MAG: metal-dependent hydrolase [Thermoleophilaceae bacterium]|nr:metal-dependent hydrolase [Thermoleophilaceae bacterium]
MMASTHAAVGVVAYGGAVALSGGHPQAVALAAAALGSWLPDVDTPTSRAGWVLSPLAVWLEARFGHRTITHSVVGVGIFALLISPLLFVATLRPLFAPLLVGYVMHLFGDAATKSGVPLAWPRPERFVFPGNEAYRLKTGSMAEVVVLGVVLLLGVLFVPVAKYGTRGLLHQALGTMEGAVRDAEDYGQRWRCVVEVEGVDEQEQRVVSGTWPLIGRRLDGSLLIDRNGRPWVVGKGGSETWRIEVRRVRLHRVSPWRPRVVTVHVANTRAAELCGLLHGRLSRSDQWLWDTRLSGEMECYPWREAPREMPRLGAKTVRVGGQRITLDLATIGDLIDAAPQAVIKEATITLRLPPSVEPPKVPVVNGRITVVAGPLQRRADLRLAAGDVVQRGQRLATNLAEREARADIAADEAALKRAGLWREIGPSLAARRSVSLRRVEMSRPPWPAVVEAVEWEPPVMEPGQRPQHFAMLQLVQIAEVGGAARRASLRR